MGRGDPLPVVRTAARLLGDVPDLLLPLAEADLVRPAVDGEQRPRLPALLGHRDLAVPREGLLREEPEQGEHPWEDLLRDLEGAVVRRDRGDHILDVSDHSAACQPDPVPLGVVLAGHPEQAEEEVPLRPPAVLQVVALRRTLPRCVECPAIAGPFLGAGVRDPKKPSGLLYLRDQRRADFRRRRPWGLRRRAAVSALSRAGTKHADG